jgi:Rps23 Pro-64 3,4-dihydroxylase Tpa1-like proline 4-hydroxylase
VFASRTPNRDANTGLAREAVADLSPRPSLSVARDTSLIAQLDGVVIPTPYVRVTEFLPERQAQRLLTAVIRREEEFEPSEPSFEKRNRQAFVLRSKLEFLDAFLDRLKSILPLVQQSVTGAFEVVDIECLVAAYGDGGFFKAHRDDGATIMSPRRLSYVYYLHRQPRPFEGGNLVIHDAPIAGEQPSLSSGTNSGSYSVVAPEHNSIIFWLASATHEILPVTSPSKGFANSRFGVTGHVRSR